MSEKLNGEQDRLEWALAEADQLPPQDLSKQIPYSKHMALKILAKAVRASIPREDAEELVRAAAGLFDEETVHQIEVGSTGCVVRCAKLKAIRTALSNFRKKHPEAGK